MKFLVAALETTKKRPEVAKHLKDIGLCLIRVLPFCSISSNTTVILSVSRFEQQ